MSDGVALPQTWDGEQESRMDELSGVCVSVTSIPECCSPAHSSLDRHTGRADISNACVVPSWFSRVTCGQSHGPISSTSTGLAKTFLSFVSTMQTCHLGEGKRPRENVHRRVRRSGMILWCLHLSRHPFIFK